VSEEAGSVDTAWFDEQFAKAKTSLRAVARRAHLNASTLSRIIHGKVPLNLAAAIVLADAFGVSIEEIIRRCAFRLPARKEPKSRQAIINAVRSKSRIAMLRKHAHPRKRKKDAY
jgi:plasmid maintenance system antidote protein VapI